MALRPHNFRALSKPKQISKKDHRHYWPYIPVLLLLIATFAVSFIEPISRGSVLAYATNMSNSGLLSSTNTQRTNKGVSILKLNNSLSSAALAKANDMVNRDYWSHNTPDGKEPWIFIDNVNYSYTKAGENLAYGFADSNETIVGWMNSPTHKANMLDGDFTEVGFGFANSSNFYSSGPETVVVAMYAKPQVLTANSSVPAPAPTSNQPAPITKNQTIVAVSPTETKTDETKTIIEPTTTDNPIVNEPPTVPISRIQSLTNGSAPWALFAVGLITGISLMFLLAKHAVSIRHLIKDSEKFILHHPLLDTILLSLILAGTLLSQTTGFIL